MVRNIFGELLEAEQSGSSSRQHSSVASEINRAFRLPRNGINARSSGSVDVSSGQSVPQPPAVNVPQEIISGAVPSFNPQLINYNSNFTRSGPVRPRRSQNRRTDTSYWRATSAPQPSRSERNFCVCLLPQTCKKIPRREAKTKLQNEGCFVDVFTFDKRWDDPTLRLKMLVLFSNMLDSENTYGIIP